MALDGKAIIKEEITDKDAYDAAAAAAVAVATTSTAASSASSSAAATTAAAISRRLKGECHGQPKEGGALLGHVTRVMRGRGARGKWLRRTLGRLIGIGIGIGSTSAARRQARRLMV